MLRCWCEPPAFVCLTSQTKKSFTWFEADASSELSLGDLRSANHIREGFEEHQGISQTTHFSRSFSKLLLALCYCFSSSHPESRSSIPLLAFFCRSPRMYFCWLLARAWSSTLSTMTASEPCLVKWVSVLHQDRTTDA